MMLLPKLSKTTRSTMIQISLKQSKRVAQFVKIAVKAVNLISQLCTNGQFPLTTNTIKLEPLTSPAALIPHLVQPSTGMRKLRIALMAGSNETNTSSLQFKNTYYLLKKSH